MTHTAPTTTPNRSRWLYQALAITGIAVGSVIIVAGLYLRGGSAALVVFHVLHGGTTAVVRGDERRHERHDDEHAVDVAHPSMSPVPNMPMPTPTR
jgi:hypothetical protein